MDLTIKPVTSSSDIPALANINERALESDPLKQWMALFTERTEYDTTVKAVTEALTDPEYRIVKAVIPDPDPQSAQGELIVGFVHWFTGYIKLEKVDPFAKNQLRTNEVKDVKDVTSNLAEELAKKARLLEGMSTGDREAVDRARRLKKGEAKYVATRNHYVAAIRGKKHCFIRRIMVVPEYQGCGVGRRLIDVVTQEADRLKIVCWLFARPAGERLYERVGFKVWGVTEMDEAEEGLECPVTKSMIRLPKPAAS